MGDRWLEAGSLGSGAIGNEKCGEAERLGVYLELINTKGSDQCFYSPGACWYVLYELHPSLMQLTIGQLAE